MTEWTDEMKDKAKAMWAKGESASRIALVLGKGLSRNAVVGKLHRMGCGGGRQTPTRAMRTGKPVRRNISMARVPNAPVVKSAPLPLEAPPPAGARLVRLEDLGNEHCRYPIGDPQAPAFGFCGQQRLEGRVYCAEHCRVAYAPSSATKRQKTGFDFTRAKA